MLILPVIGDGVVIWRAWALFNTKKLKWIMTIPCFLLSFTFLFSIVFSAALAFNGGLPYIDPFVSPKVTLYHGVYMVVLASSFITNLFTTSLIMFKLWTHHGYMRGLNFPNKLSHPEKTILLLVESGFVYAILQLLNFILGFVSPGTAFYLLFSIYYMFSGIYSSLVVILITERKSIVDTFSIDAPSISELPINIDHHAAAELQGVASSFGTSILLHHVSDDHHS